MQLSMELRKIREGTHAQSVALVDMETDRDRQLMFLKSVKVDSQFAIQFYSTV